MSRTPPWTAKQQQECTAAYEKGDSIRAIAASSGFPFGTVHRMLQSAGVQFRPRGGHRSGDPRPPWTADDAKAYRKQYDSGKTIEQVAESSLYAPSTMRVILASAGATFRHTGPGPRRWTDHEAAIFRNRYEAGESAWSIALSSPYDRRTVYKMLHHAGTQMPRPKQAKPADEHAGS